MLLEIKFVATIKTYDKPLLQLVTLVFFTVVVDMTTGVGIVSWLISSLDQLGCLTRPTSALVYWDVVSAELYSHKDLYVLLDICNNTLQS